MKDKKILRLVQAALLAALTCVATMVIQIPTGGGYLNPGDCFVQLSGWILGPWYGFIAAGLGSMLADLFAGYAMYAPGTFLIKGLDALVSALIFRAMAGRHRLAGSILGGAVGGLMMALGYFGYESVVLGLGLAAAANIPGNLAQALFGLVTAVILSEVLHRTNVWDKLR